MKPPITLSALCFAPTLSTSDQQGRGGGRVLGRRERVAGEGGRRKGRERKKREGGRRREREGGKKERNRGRREVLALVKE